MLDVDKQNTGSGRVQQGPASARLPLVVTGGSQLHDPAGCTFVDSSFGPPFLTAESFRVNEGFALAGVAALSRCAARRSHSQNGKTWLVSTEMRSFLSAWWVHSTVPCCLWAAEHQKTVSLRASLLSMLDLVAL